MLFINVKYSNDIVMSQASTSYTAEKLYEEAYNIQYNWDKILPADVLEFHTLVSKQTNAPVDLQMGTVLPFLASSMVLKHVVISLQLHLV